MKLGSVEYYQDMYKKAMENLTSTDLERRMRSSAVKDEDFKKEFEANSDEFHKFCSDFMSSLIPGRKSSLTYAVMVAALARKYGVAYEVKAGYCVKKDDKAKEKIARYKKDHKNGGEPMINHVYVQIGDKTYDYYNGFDVEMEHVDCVRIDGE